MIVVNSEDFTFRNTATFTCTGIHPLSSTDNFRSTDLRKTDLTHFYLFPLILYLVYPHTQVGAEANPP